MRRQPGAHPSPAADCQCGIYAAKRLADLARYARSFGSRPSTIVHRVVGRVALWGAVLEHTGGWRAALAYPVELFVPVPADRPRRAETVGLGLSDYGVRIELVDASHVAELVRTLEPASGTRRAA